MATLHEVLAQAENEGVAVGHFNISDLVTLKAVFESATVENVPVVVGVSEGERQFLGLRQIVALVKSLREEHSLPIFLNADHTHSMGMAIAAAKAGVDLIVFDVSTLPLEENVRQTKAAVEALKSIRPEILVEGEIGNIGSGSAQIYSNGKIAGVTIGGLLGGGPGDRSGAVLATGDIGPVTIGGNALGSAGDGRSGCSRRQHGLNR